MTEVKKPKKKQDAATKSHKAQMRQVELEKALVDLKQAQGEYELDQIRLHEARLTSEWKKAGERPSGIFRLETDVHGGVKELAAEMQQWGRLHPKKPVTLYICSPGGSVLSGFLLYDQLRTMSAQGHHITTVVRGYAASMGGVISLAGDTRLMGAESFFHIHEVSSFTIGKLFEMKDDIAFSERLNKKIEDLYVARTKVKRAVYRRKSQKTEWWMDAPEAIELGIIHAIG